MRQWTPALVCALALALAAAGQVWTSGWAFFGGIGLLVASLVALAVRAGDARPLRSRLALALASVLAIFLLFELGMTVLRAREPWIAVPYGYEDARRDPSSFLRWWAGHVRGWARIDPELVTPDPRERNPFLLAPGARIQRGEIEIAVNALGFRGPEIERDKRDLFRILVLGESTTFGLTTQTGDRPWPELLEEAIATQYRCDRRVQVVNAGVPGWTLANQLLRWDEDLAPLEPDLVISYHGYNGFAQMLEYPGLPQGRLPAPPPHPSQLLARIAYANELRGYLAKQRAVRIAPSAIRDAALGHTTYARVYLKLVRRARAQDIGVQLATFNMAVDAHSPEAVVAFYEGLFPNVRSAIVANRLHSRLLSLVAEQDGVGLLDTSRDLDGVWRDAYVDLVHFTQLGRERLAANVLDGLRPLLVTHERLRCR